MLSSHLNNATKKSMDANLLIELFNAAFYQSTNTRLMGGGHEPEYRPSDVLCPFNRITFSHDYIASALHEIAHWCIAGKVRQNLVDYGYWYEPDGRSPDQQTEFERVEVKPQALEWIFSNACQLPFKVSVDNLAADANPSVSFKQAIAVQAKTFCNTGLNERAAKWVQQLSNYTGTSKVLIADYYSADKL